MVGYNATVFAYGQTGAGKTFTIQGPTPDQVPSEEARYKLRGLMPRIFDYISENVAKHQQADPNVEYIMKCSYLEIYQETIGDLLDPKPPGESLHLREDIKKGVYVEGLVEDTADNATDLLEVLKKGAANRHIGATTMNKESSRSHSVFTLTIESKMKRDGVVNILSSRFHIIDLAGSERQKTTDAAGERLKEAGKINKSLSALGNVINSLVDISQGKSRHVHYRDSKLTFLLKDSLGGNSKTVIIANVSQNSMSSSETLTTLNFAKRAKLIKNKAVVNEDTTGTVLLLQQEIKRLKCEIGELRAKRPFTTKTPQRAMSVLPSDLTLGSQDFESILHSTVELRQNDVKMYEELLKQKDQALDALKKCVRRYKHDKEHDMMMLKFKEAALGKMRVGKSMGPNEEVEELRTENKALRETADSELAAALKFADRVDLNEQVRQKACEQNEYIQQMNDIIKKLGEEKSGMKKQIEEVAQSNGTIKADAPEVENMMAKVKLEYGEKIDALSLKYLEYPSYLDSLFSEKMEKERLQELCEKKDEEILSESTKQAEREQYYRGLVANYEEQLQRSRVTDEDVARLKVQNVELQAKAQEVDELTKKVQERAEETARVHVQLEKAMKESMELAAFKDMQVQRGKELEARVKELQERLEISQGEYQKTMATVQDQHTKEAETLMGELKLKEGLIAEVTAKCESLEAEGAKHKETIAKMEEQCQQFEATLKLKDSAVSDFEARCAKYQETVAAAQEQNKKTLEEMETLRAKCSEELRQKDCVVANCAMMEEQHRHDLELSAEEVTKTQQRCAQDIAAVVAQRDSLVAENAANLNKLQTELKQREEALAEFTEKCVKLQQTIEAAGMQMKQREEEAKSLKKNCDGEIAAIRTELKEKDAAIAECKAKYANLEEAMSAVDTEYKRELEQKESAIVECQNKCNKLEADCAKYNNEFEQKATEQQVATTDLKQKETILAEFKAKCAELGAACAKYQEAETQHARAMEQKTAEMKGVRENAATELRQREAESEARCSKFEADCSAKYQSAISTAELQHRQTMEQSVAERKRVEVALSESEARCALLVADCAKYQSEASIAETQHKQEMAAELQKRNADLSVCETKRAALEADCAKYQEALSAAELRHKQELEQKVAELTLGAKALAECEAKCNNLAAECTSYQETIARMQAEHERMKEAANVASTTQAELARKELLEFTECEAKCGRLQTALAAAEEKHKNEIAGKASEIQQKDAALVRSEAKCVQLERDCKQSQCALAGAEEQCGKLQAELAIAREALVKTRKNAANRARELETKAREDLSAQTAQIKKLESENATSRAERSSLGQKHAEELSALTRKLQETAALENEKNARARKDLESSFAQQKEEQSEAVRRTQAKLASAERELDAVSAAKEELCRKLTAVQTEKREVQTQLQDVRKNYAYQIQELTKQQASTLQSLDRKAKDAMSEAHAKHRSETEAITKSWEQKCATAAEELKKQADALAKRENESALLTVIFTTRARRRSWGSLRLCDRRNGSVPRPSARPRTMLFSSSRPRTGIKRRRS